MGRQYHNAPHHGLSLAARVVLCVLLALFFLLAPASSPAQGASSPSPGSSGAVWVMSLDGPIGPALSDWFVRSLDDANNAVLYFRVLDAQKAVINVEDFYSATSQLSQTTLRSV
ncbi:MAG: hypothetical protein MI745_01860, partial [Pseudomonadales bacterium]|nr:hypothetical protein [Pseudomonadales bacterium]